VAIREHFVADVETVGFEVFAGEVWGKSDEQVDIAVASEPGAAGGAADLDHVGIESAVIDGRPSAVGEGCRGRREPLAFLGGRRDALGDRREHVIECSHTAELEDAV